MKFTKRTQLRSLRQQKATRKVNIKVSLKLTGKTWKGSGSITVITCERFKVRDKQVQDGLKLGRSLQREPHLRFLVNKKTRRKVETKLSLKCFWKWSFLEKNLYITLSRQQTRHLLIQILKEKWFLSKIKLWLHFSVSESCTHAKCIHKSV